MMWRLHLTLIFALAMSLAPPADGFAAESKSEAWSLHFQATGIEQGHPSFSSPYSNENSLLAEEEPKDTVTSTLFLGRKLWKGAELYVNPEVFQGFGLSKTSGVAGFPNGEATGTDSRTPKPYVARLFLRQTIGLGGVQESISSDKNQLASDPDLSRITITIGKLSALDIFDNNSYSEDPRTQFLNWALVSNGAWDYPADTKGYTQGLALEYNQPNWTLRWGSFRVPLVANSPHLDRRLGKALGHVTELEGRYSFLERPGKVRLLGFLNRAHMGRYKESMSSLDVTQSRAYRSKYGFGMNAEQELTKDFGTFMRLGWNDGQTETVAFTEIDRTASLGINLKGTSWRRPEDTVGLAGLINGLSKNHRNYLAAGGLGFIIGDGRLDYAPEEILEIYYDLRIIRGISLAFDYQWVNHPAYNEDRGPVSILSGRLHYEF